MTPVAAWRLVVARPVRFFRQMRPGPYLAPFLFSAGCMAVGTAGILASQGPPTVAPPPPGAPPRIAAGDILTRPLATALLSFAWAWLVCRFIGVAGGKGDYRTVFHVCSFAAAPYALLFLPFGTGPLVAFGYGLYLTVVGLKETHGLDTRQALTAAAVPALLAATLAAMAATACMMIAAGR
ncbi:MAG: YIP1 family protein [Armatimonadetes bacterium]|nr:YIP1 family protein [Armatimonadota bacterium]